MTTCSDWSERQRTIARLRQHASWRTKKASEHPAVFRALVRLKDGEGGLLREVVQDWQQRDLSALDDAWRELAGQVVKGCVRRAYVERPRGHSKTTDMALQAVWVLQNAVRPVVGLVAAADKEQGTLLLRGVAEVMRLNSDLCGDLIAQKEQIKNRRTGAVLKVMSSDTESSWGELPDFVICDELCHWRGPEMWHSLLSSSAKQPLCVLAVLTNAGIGRDWAWDVREEARVSPRWHFSSLVGSCAPWITAEMLEEQKRMLPPAVYARLWENRWQQTDGEFVTLDEADRCADSALRAQVKGRAGTCYFAAVDYAEKHDRTAGVVLHVEGDRLVVDRMDVVTPTVDQPTPVRWVREWIEQVAAAFGNVRFVVDPYQLVGVVQEFEDRYAIERFDFAGGRKNHVLALGLRSLILEQRVRWPVGCGQVGEEGRNDLSVELSRLIVRSSGTGRIRIDHRSAAGEHDDRAFVLGAACLAALEGGSGRDWMVVE